MFNSVYTFSGYDHMRKVYDSKIGEKVFEDVAKATGVLPLGAFYLGTRQLNLVEKVGPVTKPEDMKGVKLRTPNSPAWIALGKALGGNPDELQLALKNYPINDVFMENIFGLFKLNLDPNIKQKISLVPIVSDIAISDENKEDKKFDKIANENGLDAILKINYMYGLATFERSPPKAIINAKAKLFRILDKKTIYQNSFLVYDKRAFGKHVARFAENQARLYKIDLIQEIKGLAIILAYDLRI
jgi:hypothetical protein